MKRLKTDSKAKKVSRLALRAAPSAAPVVVVSSYLLALKTMRWSPGYGVGFLLEAHNVLRRLVSTLSVGCPACRSDEMRAADPKFVDSRLSFGYTSF